MKNSNRLCKKCKHYTNAPLNTLKSRYEYNSMPVICPRCGKQLCTEQALQYHLNKKVKCNQQWKCGKCDRLFEKRRDLLLHGCYAEETCIYNVPLETFESQESVYAEIKVTNKTKQAVKCAVVFDTKQPSSFEKCSFDSNIVYEFMKRNSKNNVFQLDKHARIVKGSDTLMGRLYTTAYPQKHKVRILNQIHNCCDNEVVRKLDGTKCFISVIKLHTGYLLAENTDDQHFLFCSYP